MAFDNQGRMFVSSDYSGEIYIVVRNEASNGTSGSGSSSSGGKTSSAMRSGLGVSVLGLCAIATYLTF